MTFCYSVSRVEPIQQPVDLLESNPSKPNGRRIRESRFWVARATPRDGPWTVFDFTVSRAADGPLAFFKGYSGKITCDAYAVHDKLVLSADGVTDESRLYGCWAHEKEIRPIALGRKNWLFIGDRDAGRAAANLLTIITTCKNGKEDPYVYPLDVMQRLPLMTTGQISSLIPERWVRQASDLAAG